MVNYFKACNSCKLIQSNGTLSGQKSQVYKKQKQTKLKAIFWCVFFITRDKIRVYDINDKRHLKRRVCNINDKRQKLVRGCNLVQYIWQLRCINCCTIRVQNSLQNCNLTLFKVESWLLIFKPRKKEKMKGKQEHYLSENIWGLNTSNI